MIKQAVEAFSLMVKKIEPNTKYAPGSPFYEFEKLPGIVLEGPALREERRMDASRMAQFVKSKNRFEKNQGSRHYDLDFMLTICANRQQDLTRMVSALTSYIKTEVDLLFPVDAPKYSCYMHFVSDFTMTGNENISGVCEAKATIRVDAVPLLSVMPTETGALIESISIGIFEEEGSVIGGARIK